VHSGKGKIRIIAGEYRGRRIPVPDIAGLRPTGDRVRETLFNWLGQWLEGLSCLDLFAGSGALGFEAASRHAARVVMVENSKTAFESLQQTIRQIGARIELVFGDAFTYLQRANDKFDVVFLDPPFGQNAHGAALAAAAERLAPQGRVYVEAAAPLEPGAPWHELRRSRAGQVSYQLMERR
jgi:16S rRNA (guanine966-N2)-methyltransferase